MRALESSGMKNSPRAYAPGGRRVKVGGPLTTRSGLFRTLRAKSCKGVETMREILVGQMKDAMKAGDKIRVGTLRLIMAALEGSRDRNARLGQDRQPRR